jgi:hypothetical protein
MVTFPQVAHVFEWVLASISAAAITVCAVLLALDYLRRWKDWRRTQKTAQELLDRTDRQYAPTELDEVMAVTFSFPRTITCDHCNRGYYIESARGIRDAITLHGRYDCKARTSRLTP